MRDILAAVPAADRLLIVTFVGVANWHHDPSWNTLRFVDRDVMLAFDADVTVNPDVWREANALWQLAERKKGNPQLVALPDIGIPKMGVDDYLATSDRLMSDMERALAASQADAATHAAQKQLSCRSGSGCSNQPA